MKCTFHEGSGNFKNTPFDTDINQVLKSLAEDCMGKCTLLVMDHIRCELTQITR